MKMQYVDYLHLRARRKGLLTVISNEVGKRSAELKIKKLQPNADGEDELVDEDSIEF